MQGNFTRYPSPPHTTISSYWDKFLYSTEAWYIADRKKKTFFMQPGKKGVKWIKYKYTNPTPSRHVVL